MPSLPKASFRDSLAVATKVFLPTVAKGVIIRRPKAVAMAERLRFDEKGVRCLQRLRRRYGDGPLLVRLAGRSQAVVLSPEHLRRVLDETPEPFSSASTEKQAALKHFQPHGLLVSEGPLRTERRVINEEALQADHSRHAFAERFTRIMREESESMLAESRRALTWKIYARSWFRVVRRVVLGDVARDDTAITDILARLRADANWAFLRPHRRRLHDRFRRRLEQYVTTAEPASLASIIAGMPLGSVADPVGQMPQWLFAFDAAGIASFRALALLASHPLQAERAHREIAAAGDTTAPSLPYLRACVLESVRLWPTTPLILRQTTRETLWNGGAMPAGTGLLIYVPFFHRDESRLPFAHRFTPELWLTNVSPAEWPLIPFSAGPAACPGRELVLLLTSVMLSGVLRDHDVRLLPLGRLDAYRPLPFTLSNFSLRFTLAERRTAMGARSPSAA